VTLIAVYLTWKKIELAVPGENVGEPADAGWEAWGRVE
jgi:hypothetical protein